ncbi:MAG TPA: hypothetical protein VGO93_05815 [Candidatus Xenobia bacterium]
MDNDTSRFVTRPGDLKEFDTIEEARAWRDQQRAKFQKPVPAKKAKKPKAS